MAPTTPASSPNWAYSMRSLRVESGVERRKVAWRMVDKKLEADIADASANKNDAWIEEINQPSQDTADHLPAAADDLIGQAITGGCGITHINGRQRAAILRHPPREKIALPCLCPGHALLGYRRSGGHKFQAAWIAAVANRAIIINTNMADIARTAITAAIDLVIGDNAAANSRADLDEQEIIDTTSRRPPAAHPWPIY